MRSSPDPPCESTGRTMCGTGNGFGRIAPRATRSVVTAQVWRAEANVAASETRFNRAIASGAVERPVRLRRGEAFGGAQP